MEFMAIEVLLSFSHTYRHDLESFFYVLLWVCASHGWDFIQNQNGRPKGSMFTGWYTGTYKEIARNKFGDMDKGKGKGLEVIWGTFRRRLTVLSLCVKRSGTSYSRTETGCLLEPQRMQRSCIGPSLKRLMTP